MIIQRYKNFEETLWFSLILFQVVIYMSSTSFVQVTMEPYGLIYIILLVISWALSVPSSILLFYYCLYGRFATQTKQQVKEALASATVGLVIAVGLSFIAWAAFILILIILGAILIVHLWSGYRLFIHPKAHDI